MDKDIEKAAKTSPEEVAKYIRGPEGSERSERVNRAHSAIDALKAGITGIDDEQKKPIIQAILGELDSMRQGIPGADAPSKEVKEQLSSARNKALAQERELATVIESVTNEGREVMGNFKQMDANAVKTAALYVGVPLAIGAAVKWLFGKGDKDHKPGVIRRFFSWIAGAGATLAIFLGLRKAANVMADGKQQIEDLKNLPGKVLDDAKGLPRKLGRSAIDTVNGWYPSWVPEWLKLPGGNTPGKDGESSEKKEDPNENPQSKLERLVKEKKYVEAFVHAVSNGGGLSMEDGKAFLHIENGTPVEVTPEGVSQIRAYVESKEGGYVMLYFESGAGYLVLRSVANKILYGKKLMPSTKWGKLKSVGKVLFGPLTAVKDAAKYTSTFVFSPRGGEQLKASFVTQSLPARKLRAFTNWRRQKWLQSDIKTEAGLTETILRRQMMKDVVEVLELGIGETEDGTPVKGGDLDLAKKELDTLTSRVKAGLTVMDGKLKSGEGLEDTHLEKIVRAKDTETVFEQNLKEYADTVQAKRPELPEIKSETDEQSDLKAELSEREAERAQLETEVQEASAKAKEMSDQLADAKAKQAALEQKVEGQRQAEQQLKGDVDYLRTQLEYSRSSPTPSNDETTRLQKELDQKNDALKAMQEEHAKQQATLKADVAGLVSEKAQLEQRLQEATKQQTEANQKLAAANSENAELKDRLQQTEQQAESDQARRSSPGDEKGDAGATRNVEKNPKGPPPRGQDAEAANRLGGKARLRLDNPPPRKPIVTNPNLTGSVRLDEGLGKVDLRKGNSGGKDIDGKPDIRFRK